MKEMIYEVYHEPEVLDSGIYKNRKYVIINMGGLHPCAYVECENGIKQDYEDIHTPAHCSFTFFGPLNHWKGRLNVPFDINFVGWDFGHLGDYNPYFGRESDKKWTTEEVFENIKQVIDWMEKCDL